MFTDLLKRRKPAKDQAVAASPLVENIGLDLNPSDPFPFADDLDVVSGVGASGAGLEIKDFARQRGISPNDVWDLIESGLVNCQSRQGKLLVFESEIKTQSSPQPEIVTKRARASAVSQQAVLPPLPEFGASAETKGPQAPNPAPQPMAELALIIDHLSLAKEENKDILRLTQDSIKKISQLSDCVVALKDELIRARDEKIEHLKEQVEGKNAQLSKLRQEMEDLQILASTLNFKPQPKT